MATASLTGKGFFSGGAFFSMAVIRLAIFGMSVSG
jgi:hypothetical protein